MPQFFRSVFRQLCVHITALALLLILLIGASILWIHSLEDPTPNIKPGTILVVDLSNTITDAPEAPNWSNIFERRSLAPPMYLLEAIRSLEYAAKDERIAGILIKSPFISRAQTDLAVLAELHLQLMSFKDSQKPIHAYLEAPTIGNYFTGALADSITLHPLGQLDFKGLRFEAAFFGDAFKKYGVGVQPVRVGRYKSGIEPFTDNQMSPENRKQWQETLDYLWSFFAFSIAEHRQLDKNIIFKASHQEPLMAAPIALDWQLADQLGYLEDALEAFKGRAAWDEEEHAYQQVSLQDYASSIADEFTPMPNTPKVTLLYAEGPIINGEHIPGSIASDELIAQLHALEHDASTHAVVLRINSVGGSASAASSIQVALERLRSKKPVIISMGNIAASGGYWIASESDYIVANPMTITGSIGAFMLTFNIEKLASDYGIQADAVQTGPYAGLFSLMEEKTPTEIAILKEGSSAVYETFLNVVSQNRNLDMNATEDAADGRIWTSSRAQQHGLVDGIGSLKYAIFKAAEIAQLDDWTLEEYPKWQGFRGLLDGFNEDSALMNKVRKTLGLDIDVLLHLSRYQEAQAIMPYHVKIR